MILAPIIFAALAQKSLFQQVIEHPDPNNGYDDYVRAADIAQSGMASMYTDWTPHQYDDLFKMKQEIANQPPPKGDEERQVWSKEEEARLKVAEQLRNRTYLEIQQQARNRFASALELIRQGNLKPIHDPREQMSVETLFPELAQFRSLAKLIKADVYVRFAVGDSAGATDDLIQGLIFSRRIAVGGMLIGELVAIACEAILYGFWEEHLAQMSDRDADQVVRFVDAALAEPPMLPQAIRSEEKMILGSLDELLSSRESLAGFDGGDDPMVDYMKYLTPAQRERIKSGLIGALRPIYDKLVESVSGDESKWSIDVSSMLPANPTAIKSDEDLIDSLLNILLPVFDRAPDVELRARCQLRLLGLHARIIAFRWHNNRLPKELHEAVPDAMIFDPMGKEPFHYELTADGYRLYGKGLPGTGVVELKYRRPPNLGQNDAIPPLP